MKLTDIKTFVVGNPPPGNGGRYFVFVKLSTEGNVHGVGEAYCVPFHPELVARLLVDIFERYLQGEDPHDIEKLWRRVYSAGYTQHPDLTLMGVLSALEMACWDIIGKEAGSAGLQAPRAAACTSACAPTLISMPAPGTR